MKNRLIALLVLFTVTFFVSSAQAQTTARKFEAGKNSVGNEYDLYLYFLEYP